MFDTDCGDGAMYKCKRLLADAQVHFWRGEWDRAESLYINACEEAESNLQQTRIDAELIETVVLCYHRLAGFMLIRGRAPEAMSVCEKIDCLLSARLMRMSAVASHRQDLHRACMKNRIKINAIFKHTDLMLPFYCGRY